MNPSQDPNDRLLDSLLRERARGHADEDLLRAIDARLDDVPHIRGASQRRAWPWLSAAAVIAFIAVGISQWGRDRPLPAPLVAESLEAPLVAESSRSGSGSPLVVPAPLPVPGPMVESTIEAKPAPVPTDIARNKERGSEGRPVAPMAPAPVDLADLEGFVLPGEAPAAQTDGVLGRRTGFGGGIGPEASPAAARSRTRVGGNAAPPPLPGRAIAEEGLSRESYGRLVDSPWRSPWQDSLSTFSVDVDTASYTNLRRLIQQGAAVPADAVRIEEMVNYFDYGYAGPAGDGPFAVHGTLATCPWNPRHLLARVALRGREIEANNRPASNLMFLIDVSGSMQDADKLPLLKRSLRVLLDQLDERDRLGIVVYAGRDGVVLEPTGLDERGISSAIRALEKLEAGGSTNGGAGLKRAYELAARHLVTGGVNRVILATDGDFNVGTTGQGELVKLVKQGAEKGVSLTVLGFGRGNFNDAMLEAVTNEGNGNYFYLDGDHEARRVFLQKLTGTLVTIAKDVKIQVEFNPGKVTAYRLIGYANRVLRHEDFNNDEVDAGDIGAGHTVTAFYEIVPPGVEPPATGSVDALRYQKPEGREVVPSEDWFTLKLRYKHPEGDASSLIQTVVKGEPAAWEQAGQDFRFASAVALSGMKLREMEDVADISWQRVADIAGTSTASEQRTEFVGLLKKLDPRVELAGGPREMEGSPEDGLGELSYLREESTMWYVKFGLESGGKWAPRLTALSADKAKLTNRVNALSMLSPGDVFFADGPFAKRFRFMGIEERDVQSERTGLVSKVKFALYEDQEPSKAGVRYESQSGLPDADLEKRAYYDRSAFLSFGGQNFQVEEGAKFRLPVDASGKEHLLRKVEPDRVVIETASENGRPVVREIPR